MARKSQAYCFHSMMEFPLSEMTKKDDPNKRELQKA
jgi:hypothetical protein